MKRSSSFLTLSDQFLPLFLFLLFIGNFLHFRLFLLIPILLFFLVILSIHFGLLSSSCLRRSSFFGVLGGILVVSVHLQQLLDGHVLLVFECIQLLRLVLLRHCLLLINCPLIVELIHNHVHRRFKLFFIFIFFSFIDILRWSLCRFFLVNDERVFLLLP